MLARALLFFLLLASAPVHNAETIHYQLLYGSAISYKVGGSSAGFWGAKGSLDLRFIEQNGDVARYAIENAHVNGDSAHQFTGSGTLNVTAGARLNCTLTLTNVAGPDSDVIVFTNISTTPDRKWPMLALRARQPTVNDAAYTIDIRAAPFRDIWISPAIDFRANALPAGANMIHSGDLVSLDGRIIKRNAELLAAYGSLTPADCGLDAVALAPGGGLAFSTHAFASVPDSAIFMPAFRNPISYTDIFTNAVATAMTDPGIDGLHFTSPASFYFSVKRDATYSIPNTAPITLRDGDIWWTDLQTHELRRSRSREELFAFPDYQPWLVDPSVGIDAFYIWPSGEVWFSLRSSWTAHTAIYSSDGYPVFTDTFIFESFKPATDPGLDAFLVITDLTSTESAPPFIQPANISPTGDLTLHWQGAGGAYLVERASKISGPFESLSPITANQTFVFSMPTTNAGEFFRVRQW